MAEDESTICSATIILYILAVRWRVHCKTHWQQSFIECNHWLTSWSLVDRTNLKGALIQFVLSISYVIWIVAVTYMYLVSSADNLGKSLADDCYYYFFN